MDIFDRILKDHDMFRARFDEMRAALEAGDAERSGQLFIAQYELLIAHHQTEEEVVFTQLVREAATREITEEAWEEHHAINRFLNYVKDSPRKVRWAAKVKVLEEYVGHHLDEEEEEMFPQAREAFSRERLERMVPLFEEKLERRLERLRKQREAA